MQFTANSFTLNVGVVNLDKGNLQTKTGNTKQQHLQITMQHAHHILHVGDCHSANLLRKQCQFVRPSCDSHHLSFPSYNITEVKQHCYKLFKPNHTFPTPEQKTIYSDTQKHKGKININCLSKHLGHHPAARTASVHLGDDCPSIVTL